MDGTVMQRVDEPPEMSEGTKIDRAEDVSMKAGLIPFSLLWVCRLNQIVFVYLYHDW